MSQNLWNIHNYSKPPQAQPPVYRPSTSVTGVAGQYVANEYSNEDFQQNVNLSTGPNSFQLIHETPSTVTRTCVASEFPNGNSFHNVYSSSEQNGIHQIPSNIQGRITPAQENQPIQFSTSWREKASIEDWKAYLMSTSPRPVNRQTPQLPPRQQNQYGLHTDTVFRNRIAQQHPTAYTSYSYAFNGGFRPAIGHETKKNSGMIDNRRIFMERLRVNNTAAKDWFQNRLLENRMKSEYNYYPPGLLERIRLDKEKIRVGLAHVETLMNNPNEHGYVMLDDRAINVLVTVIDRILPKDLNLEMLMTPEYQY
ncbi:hypothetical protein evm_014085 [Chilo suppressalis]|nr:hypothetical protein evm_014085 [Chilo suppressalis]